ncbi:MAG: hypothetical protein JW829_08830 [Pirellulales bacterium]|nr:hypothetical protein [Pirellulales bacterium]
MFSGRIVTVSVLMACLASAAYGEEIRYYQGDNGATYQETRRFVQRPVVTTEWEEQQRTTYRQELRQEIREVWRTCYLPVTEHCWVSRLHGRWNPFITPYYTHHLLPVTRWEPRAEVVKLPTWRTEWVPQNQTERVPLTRQRMVESEVVERSVVSNPTSALGGSVVARSTDIGPTRIARQPPYHYGGIALTSDPPRQATGWRSSDSAVRR